jgi:hypothetical protein
MGVLTHFSFGVEKFGDPASKSTQKAASGFRSFFLMIVATTGNANAANIDTWTMRRGNVRNVARQILERDVFD